MIIFNRYIERKEQAVMKAVSLVVSPGYYVITHKLDKIKIPPKTRHLEEVKIQK